MTVLAVPLSIPSTRPRQILAAYRGLLRAITYQPDPVVRAFLRETAKKRFRSKAGIAVVNRSEKRYKRRLTKVKTETRRIERANSGVLDDVVKILGLAYGREGPRRRFLLKDLLQPEEEDLPQDDAGLRELILGDQVTSLVTKVNTTKRFDAFLKSQLALPADIQRGNASFKDLKPKIPTANLWGRPIPQKRQVKLRKQWWADALEKIHPPVPHHEWDRLRCLATGVTPMWNFILPRKAPEVSEKLVVVDDELVVNNLRNPAREKGTLEWRADHRRVFVAPKTKDAVVGNKTLKTAYNFERTMRRVYGRIWAITPKMYKNLDTKEWVVEWGDALSPIFDTPVATLSGNQLELFEGVDSNLQQNKKRTSRGRAEPVRKTERTVEVMLNHVKAEAKDAPKKPQNEKEAKRKAEPVPPPEVEMAVPQKTILPVDVPDDIPKEKHFVNWDPESSFWKPEPPSLEEPQVQHSKLVLKKMLEETMGVSKEAINQLARRQKELLGLKGTKGTKLVGRGIMRTLPTRKELAANKKDLGRQE